MGTVAALYWLVGLGGYLCFRQRTSGDLLRNFGSQHHTEGLRGAYEHALKLCYGLSILGSVPLVIMPFQVGGGSVGGRGQGRRQGGSS